MSLHWSNYVYTMYHTSIVKLLLFPSEEEPGGATSEAIEPTSEVDPVTTTDQCGYSGTGAGDATTTEQPATDEPASDTAADGKFTSATI